MVVHTRLCDLFGIEYPVLNAPMGGGDAPGELAAAVSAAGGLGLIGGTTIGGEDWLVTQIRRARELTDRPFGVGFISHIPNAAELMGVALREGVRIIAHSFADPSPFVAAAHDAGALVLCQVRTVEDARRAADAGVDVVTAQGTEAGGHTGMVSTLPLVPAVVDAVSPVPVVAAGGIADGRGIAAALMLGADGVWMGTRFLATRECGVSDAYKARRDRRERQRHGSHGRLRHRARYAVAGRRLGPRRAQSVLRYVDEPGRRTSCLGRGTSRRVPRVGRRRRSRPESSLGR